MPLYKETKSLVPMISGFLCKNKCFRLRYFLNKSVSKCKNLRDSSDLWAQSEVFCDRVDIAEG